MSHIPDLIEIGSLENLDENPLLRFRYLKWNCEPVTRAIWIYRLIGQRNLHKDYSLADKVSEFNIRLEITGFRNFKKVKMYTFNKALNICQRI